MKNQDWATGQPGRGAVAAAGMLLAKPFHLTGIQFLSIKWFTNGEYLHPVSILIEIGVLVRKKCVQKCLFFSLMKKRFPPCK